MFTPSLQQRDIFDWVLVGHGNARIDARAGTGKTTTLLQAVTHMRGQILFLAFNKAIAEEIKTRLATMPLQPGARAEAATFHSVGFRAWRRRSTRPLEVDSKKVLRLAQERFDDRTAQLATRLVSYAKQHALGFLQPMHDPEPWHHLIRHYGLDEDLPEGYTAEDLDGLVAAGRLLLTESNNLADEVLDFDDQLYLPLLYNARMFQYDWVLIDEAQDTNPARRALAKKLLRPGGRLVAVGDPFQAIYGFTGADSDALDILSNEFGAARFPLTRTYRCAKAIVAHAQQWVPDFEAAPTNPDGEIRLEALDKLAPAPGSAVLCRNTAPLVELAYRLIRQNISCRVEGRDIGRGLQQLLGRWKVRGLPALEKRLLDYREREVAKFMAKGEELKAASVADRVETLLVIMENCATLDDVQEILATMFSDTSGDTQRVVLCTIHRSKGREWDTVYWLGRAAFQPSKYARQQWQLAQEEHLMYVAATRAKTTLVHVPVTPTKR